MKWRNSSRSIMSKRELLIQAEKHSMNGFPQRDLVTTDNVEKKIRENIFKSCLAIRNYTRLRKMVPLNSTNLRTSFFETWRHLSGERWRAKLYLISHSQMIFQGAQKSLFASRWKLFRRKKREKKRSNSLENDQSPFSCSRWLKNISWSETQYFNRFGS